jgi:hypothetical protein
MGHQKLNTGTVHGLAQGELLISHVTLITVKMNKKSYDKFRLLVLVLYELRDFRLHSLTFMHFHKSISL